MAQAPATKLWYQAGTPLYAQVRERIAESIRSGAWRPGEAIPVERRLCAQFGVSMGTLRKAVDELTASGLLVRQQGRGTYVGKHSEDRYLFSFFHLVGRDGRKAYPEVRFVSFDTPVADAHAATRLSVAVGSPLLRLTNLLSLQGREVSVDEVHLPAPLFEGLDAVRLRARKTTLYQMYQDEFGITVVNAAERVRAFAATRKQARLLNVQVGAPLLQIVRTAYTFQQRPVELRYTYVNTEHCEYRPDTFVRDSP